MRPTSSDECEPDRMLQVVKLGGSSLTRPSLLDDLSRWRRPPTKRQTLAIIGGGGMINAVRQWDRLRPTTPADVHWLCVDLLNASFTHLRSALQSDERFADDGFLATGEQWSQWLSTHRPSAPSVPSGGSSAKKLTGPSIEREGKWWWLNVPAFYHPHRSSADEWSSPLPENWQTTTDAIAWWLADQLSADRCVLLKSCSVPHADDPERLIDEGIIDQACRHLLGSSVPLIVRTLASSRT